MTTSPSRDRGKALAFAAAVLVLAAVGVYLTMSPPSGDDGGGQREQSLGAAAPTAAATTPAAAPSQVATTPGTFDVYAYLPLSREELGAAADLARRFTASYGTFQYGEDPAAFANRLKAFATVEFGAQLTRAMTDPALVSQNKADQVVSRGTAKVRTIRDVTANQVVLVVDALRHVTDRTGEKDQDDQYAVTVVKVGADWRVYDMEPADAGQDGDSNP
ncbi:hypothetical protein GCM10009530_31200 [Microbispora corallina]|uniref:Mce-associated membrane protein n=1 Tax=Microbispora corallina TaxID=83302 RepID=A0ABQ4G0H5_9ACTN|nr:hypothetical protein [Microbispora corallina]GIH40550.1 hypothetical protein Mco01_35500 [Microbispora corallina]